jgi:hypothetical protein
LEPRLFIQHEKGKLHRKQGRQVISKGQKSLRLATASDLADEAIWTRIHCAWWLAKEDIAIHKFPSHLESTLIAKGLEPPKAYKDEHFAWELVEIIGKHFQENLKNRIRKSPYFGIMADETTDNSVDQQLIVYIKFLDKIDGIFHSTVCFLGLVSPANGSAEDIKV